MYTGSFDPVTNGHIDIICRGAKMFDKLYVAVAQNVGKDYLFSLEERVNLLKEACNMYDNVEIVVCDCLAVEFAKRLGAKVMLRGLRVMTDFEYELQMEAVNKTLDPEIETIFMMTSTQYSFLSSSSVKEMAKFGGDVSKLVPGNVNAALKRKYQRLTIL